YSFYSCYKLEPHAKNWFRAFSWHRKRSSLAAASEASFCYNRRNRDSEDDGARPCRFLVSARALPDGGTRWLYATTRSAPERSQIPVTSLWQAANFVVLHVPTIGAVKTTRSLKPQPGSISPCTKITPRGSQ